MEAGLKSLARVYNTEYNHYGPEKSEGGKKIEAGWPLYTYGQLADPTVKRITVILHAKVIT